MTNDNTFVKVGETWRGNGYPREIVDITGLYLTYYGLEGYFDTAVHTFQDWIRDTEAELEE